MYNRWTDVNYKSLVPYLDQKEINWVYISILGDERKAN